MDDTPQQALLRAARARGMALSGLSKLLGRNQAYLGQFVHRGSPRMLPERERRVLADMLDMDEVALGAPARDDVSVAVPWLAVTAAAGSGRVAEERLIRHEPLPRAMLRTVGVAPADASLINVAGESMAPTLLDGDRLLVDLADRRPNAHGGVYVIRIDTQVAVKRVFVTGTELRVVSDNADWAELRLPVSELVVIGRARLLMRDL